MISIANYSPADHAELLRLLLVLHSSYFKENAPQQFQELREEKAIKKSYENYLTGIEKNKDGTWKILVAKTDAGLIAGFIIGSISKDEHLVLGNIGKLEDWFVDPQYRRQDIGQSLYNELEKWFKEKGCRQVTSGTWEGNDLSLAAHKKAGFFISEITFSKKIL
jgi:ribosomal protein S18 acetylase RimI-like enzyme